MSDAIEHDAHEEAQIDTQEVEQASGDRTDDRPDRLRALEEIARAREEAEGYRRVEDDEPEQEQAPPADDDTTLKALGYYRSAQGELVTKLKVNGVEREVNAEQMRAFMQKDLAGDWKLQQAAEKERQLRELAESLQQQRDQQMKKSLAQPQPPLGAEEAKKQARLVLEKIWDGDSDAASEELAKIIQRNNATVDQSQILEEARRAALSSIEQREQQRQFEEWNRSVDEGNRSLKERHPQIYADQYLFDLVNGETARMVEARNAGVPEFASMTPQAMIERAAESVQEWLGQRGGQKPTTREQRKSNLKPTPRGMGAVQAKQKQEVDMSPAAVIERMAAARRVV